MISKKLLAILLSVVMLIGTSTSIMADGVDGYQQVIDEVNKMFNANIAIPVENHDEVYANLAKYTRSEFKRKLIKDYQEALAIIEMGNYNVQMEYGSSTARYSETTMVASWGSFEARGNRFGQISVSVGLENNPNPIFVKYIKADHTIYKDRVHYRASSVTHSIQNIYKELLLKCTGMYFTADGIALTSKVNINITYYANGATPTFQITK